MAHETPKLKLAEWPFPIVSQDVNANLVEHCNDLLCSHTLDGRLLSANSTPARLLGYTVEELLRIPMRELLAPEALEEFEKYLVRIRVEGTSSGYMILLTRSGERRTWEFRNTLLTTESGSQIVLGTAHDVTEQRHAELELREAELQFRASAECFRRKLEAFIATSLLASPLPQFPDAPPRVGETLRARERDYIVRVLRETRGIISGPTGAASRLGVKRTTLQSKIKQFGISRAELLG
jgi:PAS domain S-box-containing protein